MEKSSQDSNNNEKSKVIRFEAKFDGADAALVVMEKVRQKAQELKDAMNELNSLQLTITTNYYTGVKNDKGLH